MNLLDDLSGIHKRIYPESFDFGMPSVELIGTYSKGLDKQAMQKRAAAFDDVIPTFKRRPGYQYMHIITTGGMEKYSCNSNGDFWPMYSVTLHSNHPKTASCTSVTVEGGLSKYHDDTYMKNGAVYKEHETKRNGKEASGYLVAARVNEPMCRGELLIGVDEKAWEKELQKKASGEDIHFSIGADVTSDICSVCLNEAKTGKDYCEHILYKKGSITDDGVRVGMVNVHPSFYDISGVACPADKIAFALRKVASTTPYDYLETMLPYNLAGIPSSKKAATADKLAKIRKEISACSTEDPAAEGCDIDEEDEDKLVKALKGFDPEEAICGCTRKAILLSPKALYKLIGEGDPDFDHLMDDQEMDMDGVFEELASRGTDTMYDSEKLTDLKLMDILDQFVPKLSLDPASVGDRVIQITITRRAPKKASVKCHKKASKELTVNYANYVTSFASRHSDDVKRFAVTRMAHIV